jgi:hypothetical protein
MKFSEATSGSATDRGRCSYPNLVADVLHRLEEPVQHSQKRQVACGKNGTSAAILGKRRLLGERMLAVCNAGIWRMSDDINEATRRETLTLRNSLMTDHGVR